MGLGNIGPGMLILIIIVALLLFGPNKLPELGRAMGRTLKEFKKGAKDIVEDDEQDHKDIQRSESSNQDNDNRRLPD